MPVVGIVTCLLVDHPVDSGLCSTPRRFSDPLFELLDHLHLEHVVRVRQWVDLCSSSDDGAVHPSELRRDQLHRLHRVLDQRDLLPSVRNSVHRQRSIHPLLTREAYACHLHVHLTWPVPELQCFRNCPVLCCQHRPAPHRDVVQVCQADCEATHIDHDCVLTA